MPRRDAFSKLRSTQGESDAPNPNISPVVKENASGVRPLDFIPAAEPRKRRERKWERAHRAEIATYRGVPPETHQTLIRIADVLRVPVDEIARAFLEYSLGQYQAGQLPLNPYPKAQRMTLFPKSSQAKITSTNTWLQEVLSINTIRQQGKKIKSPKNWESRVTYRLPPELKEKIKQVANEHSVGIGELVLFLFLHALDAFINQRLQLRPQPKFTGKTLFPDHR